MWYFEYRVNGKYVKQAVIGNSNVHIAWQILKDSEKDPIALIHKQNYTDKVFSFQ